MTSTFSYGEEDFIVAMTTPYGTTTFRHEPSSGEPWVEATDASGGRERLEQHLTDGHGATATEPSANVPTGFSGSNATKHLDHLLVGQARDGTASR
jgi:hypothetical protein